MMYNNPRALPYDKIYIVDTEFYGNEGDIKTPVCLVVRELISGVVERYWRDELVEMEAAPFDLTSNALFVAYYASAEFSTFLALGWELPEHVFDCFAEFRCQTNGTDLAAGKSLLGALQYFGIQAGEMSFKANMRDLILTGGPWSFLERTRILNYCESDVDALTDLLKGMLAKWPLNELDLGHALLRGRYMRAVARMEHIGTPIDVQIFKKLKQNWPHLKNELIKEVDKLYDVYDKGSFKQKKFEAYLDRENIAWPRLETGHLKLDRDTFRQRSKSHYQLGPLQQLRSTLSEMRELKLTVGQDGRNRTLLSPFASKTGRNQPSTTKFIFGLPAWIRGLIKPICGRAVAYLDFSSQEIAIAAALSGDEKLWDAYASGDPYIQFAIQANLAPEKATKNTHPEVRSKCKVIMLGVQYGMSAYGMAHGAGIHFLDAKDLLQRHKDVYRTFWKWAAQNANAGLAGVQLHTVFGWKIQAGMGQELKQNTYLNWPMQANGAEMLRLTCCMATESGINVCAPVHDAILIEGPTELIQQHIEQTSTIMSQASEYILGKGRKCRVDFEVFSSPERYADSRGTAMWAFIMSNLSTGPA